MGIFLSPDLSADLAGTLGGCWQASLAPETGGAVAVPPGCTSAKAFCYHQLHVSFLLSMDESGSISVPREALMDEVPTAASGSRRNEDIALDLMKFVAMTTGYGRTSSSGVGFQGGGAAAKPEDYAAHLLELYGKCLQAVAGKK
jgi:hypothetical protein